MCPDTTPPIRESALSPPQSVSQSPSSLSSLVSLRRLSCIFPFSSSSPLPLPLLLYTTQDTHTMRISCPSYRLRDTAKARATFDTLSLGVADGLFAPRARCLYEFPGEIAGFEIFCGTSDSNRWKAHDIRIFEIRLPPARRLTSSIPFLPHILIKATTCPTSNVCIIPRRNGRKGRDDGMGDVSCTERDVSVSLLDLWLRTLYSDDLLLCAFPHD